MTYPKFINRPFDRGLSPEPSVDRLHHNGLYDISWWYDALQLLYLHQLKLASAACGAVLSSTLSPMCSKGGITDSVISV